MPRQIITTADAPSSPLYSQAVRAGANIFVSGLVGIDPTTKALAGGGVRALVHDRSAGTLRGQARRGPSRGARLDTDDGLRRVGAPGAGA